MPKLSRDEIKELVDKGEVLAITIDTSIFDKFGCNLQYKSLTSVEQFKGKHIDFLLSSVTAGEVKAHISRDIADAAAKALAGINQFLKATRSSIDLASTVSGLGLNGDPATQADTMFAEYVTKVGASIITEQVSSDDLLDLYFAGSPPFGSKSDKKSEFPDAIALLALELWASKNDTLLIVVSRDGDWDAFAQDSERLICLQELPIALGLFNDQESVIAARVAAAISSGASNSLDSVIDRRLGSYLEEFDVEASSSFMYDYETEGAEVLGWEYEDEISVVESTEDQVVISFDIAVKAAFEAAFAFSVRDSIDRDYVNLGVTRASSRQTFTVTVVATFDKSSDRDPEPYDIEIEGRGVTVDFGNVDPDWD